MLLEIILTKTFSCNILPSENWINVAFHINNCLFSFQDSSLHCKGGHTINVGSSKKIKLQKPTKGCSDLKTDYTLNIETKKMSKMSTIQYVVFHYLIFHQFWCCLHMCHHQNTRMFHGNLFYHWSTLQDMFFHLTVKMFHYPILNHCDFYSR
jgi:hypothetical protein